MEIPINHERHSSPLKRIAHGVIILGGICSFLHAAELRTWTDDRGRKVEASLLLINKDSVILKLKNGREVAFPLNKLSEEDQEFVENYDEDAAEDGESKTGQKVEKRGVNFSDPWPDKVSFDENAEIAIISENTEEKKFVYESTNYTYRCDVRLSKSVVKSFSEMFEATFTYCRKLPLALDGNADKKAKLTILLFEKFEDYVEAGGPPSSAGVYMGGQNVVMVPLASLGVKKVGSGYMLDRDKSSKVLPHELTHQLTPHSYYEDGSIGWFSEGLADYVAVTPYGNGTFKVKNNGSFIVEYACAYGKKENGGRALGYEIKIPSLKSFMTMSYDSFTGNANRNYGIGLLLTYYFFHMDGEGDAARVKEFLKAMREGKTGDEAFEKLLDGRSWAQMEEDIVKGWKRERVTFVFGSSK
jgi:hypothetical protein